MKSCVSIPILRKRLDKALVEVERAAAQFDVSNNLRNGRALHQAIAKNAKAFHEFQYHFGRLLWPNPIDKP